MILICNKLENVRGKRRKGIYNREKTLNEQRDQQTWEKIFKFKKNQNKTKKTVCLSSFRDTIFMPK